MNHSTAEHPPNKDVNTCVPLIVLWRNMRMGWRRCAGRCPETARRSCSWFRLPYRDPGHGPVPHSFSHTSAALILVLVIVAIAAALGIGLLTI
jgi:hypothetical protein